MSTWGYTRGVGGINLGGITTQQNLGEIPKYYRLSENSSLSNYFLEIRELFKNT